MNNTDTQPTNQPSPSSPPESMNNNTPTSTSESPEPVPSPDSNSVPEPTRSVGSSMSTSSESTTETSGTSERSRPESRPEGPLSSLAHKAAETQLGRKASQNIPESARPTLDRASRVLNTVDEHLLAAKDTLDTDEGRRVVKSAAEFFSSILAFVAMLFTACVSSAERRLDIQPGNESSPQRFVKVCREATNRVRNRCEAREKKVDGTCEARIYAHARHAMDAMYSAFNSSLKGLSDFSGPGKDYVAPTAHRFISILPDDMQTAVRESKGPVETLRDGWATCCASCQNYCGQSCQSTCEQKKGPCDRMKVD